MVKLCQLDWAMEGPDIWANIILRGVFLQGHFQMSLTFRWLD